MITGNMPPTEDLKRLQARLSAHLRLEGLRGPIRLVAGVDARYLPGDREGICSAVLWDTDRKLPVEVSTIRGAVEFPYIPGLFSFREAPLALRAIRGLSRMPDVLLVDGHGICHPRGFGLACHIGLRLGIPSIGCAKSLIKGFEFRMPDIPRGSHTYIHAKTLPGRPVGAVLRTKAGVKPLFVSPGHRTDVRSSMEIVLLCSGRYRIPDPLRLAHQYCGRVPLHFSPG